MPSIDSGNIGGGFDGITVPPVTFDESSETYWAEFDAEEQPASEAIVTVLSSASACDEMDLPPLYQSVDADALNALFMPASSGGRPPVAEVTFEHAGHVVTVDRERTITVKESRLTRTKGTVEP